jgi:hypothetical protein
MAQINRTRRQVVLTLAPATATMLTSMVDRWGLSRGKLVDLAIESLSRQVDGRKPLPLRDVLDVLGEFRAEGEPHDTPTHPKSAATTFSGQLPEAI